MYQCVSPTTIESALEIDAFQRNNPSQLYQNNWHKYCEQKLSFFKKRLLINVQVILLQVLID